MSDGLVHRESPIEYFKGLIDGALEHQRLDSSEQTTFYIVHLLAGFISARDGLDDEPLAMRLAKALQTGGVRQREGLRQVGDLSLFISGFFSDSLNRRLVDVDYYVALGGYAYGSLSRRDEDARAVIFAELADKFVRYVDVLCEVSEQTLLTSNSELLRLYEKWLRTGSRRDGERLAERGIVPNSSIGQRFVQ
jgi:hypothetical protein